MSAVCSDELECFLVSCGRSILDSLKGKRVVINGKKFRGISP